MDKGNELRIDNLRAALEWVNLAVWSLEPGRNTTVLISNRLKEILDSDAVNCG